jgi:hypothetical protein
MLGHLRRNYILSALIPRRPFTGSRLDGCGNVEPGMLAAVRDAGVEESDCGIRIIPAHAIVGENAGY